MSVRESDVPQQFQQAIVIGGGRMGRTLGAMLTACGVSLRCCTGRTVGRAKEAQHVTLAHSTAVFAAVHAELSETLQAELAKLPADGSSVVLLALRDDDYVDASAVVATGRSTWEGISVLHVSGGLDLTVLSPLAERGARCGILHPCYPVFEPLPTIPSRVCYTYRGDSALGELCAALVTDWCGEMVKLGEIDVSLYHAAAVLAAGHLTTLVAASEKMFESSGLSSEQAAKVSSSIFGGVLENVRGRQSIDVINKITGPFVRGDAKMIARHEAAVASVSTDVANVYAALGQYCEALLKSR